MVSLAMPPPRCFLPTHVHYREHSVNRIRKAMSICDQADPLHSSCVDSGLR